MEHTNDREYRSRDRRRLHIGRPSYVVAWLAVLCAFVVYQFIGSFLDLDQTLRCLLATTASSS